MNLSALGKSAYILLLSFISLNANSATLNVDSGGNLLGAFDVDVGGTLYNVEFVDGSCSEVFDGCDGADDFTFFQSESDALLASQALIENVFIDVSLGMFDSDPKLTSGCDNQVRCFVYTPWVTDFSMLISLASARNLSPSSGFSDVVLSQQFSFSVESALSDSAAWARWSTPSPVPVPAALVLFASALAGMTGVRLTRRHLAA